MKNKMIVFAIALSLLFSVMLVAIGGDATYVEEVDESLESDPELAQLADSPWPSFGRDRNNTARSPYDTSHVDGTERWNFTTGGNVLSGPTIGEDGTIYVGSNEEMGEGALYAIDQDGDEKWSFETGGDIDSSPAISEDGMIYVGSHDNNLYAIHSEHSEGDAGTEEWSADVGHMVERSSPAIGEDGTIYVGSHDNHLYAIDPDDGTEKWDFETASAVTSSPAIGDDGTIYVGSWDGNLYAVNPEDGTEKWTFESEEGEVRINSSPAVGEDGTIYVGLGAFDGESLVAINPDNGEKEWSFEPGDSVESSPAIAEDGTIYVGSSDGNLHAVNPEDGEEEWSFETGDEVHSSPAIGGDGTIYVGSDDDHLYAINPDDGEEEWSYETGDEVYSSPAIGSDGTIYVGSNDNNLYAITGEHDLTINIEGEGSTDPQEGNHTYLHGEEVTVTATPGRGFYFDGWTGDNESEKEEITITMDEDKEITANFEEYVILTIEDITGQGTVFVDGDEMTEKPFHKDYEQGEEADLSADPDQDWYFADWEGIAEEDADIEITMEEDVTINNVLFEEYVSLTIDSTDGGEVTKPGEGDFDYEQGEVVDLEAQPDEDHHLVEWTGDIETIEDITANQTTITMYADYEIQAEFAETDHHLTIDSTDGGEVVEPGEGTFPTADGEDVDLEAVAEDGYYFVEWTGDNGTIADTEDNHTTITMDDDYTITAEFDIEAYELTIDSTEGGEVTLPGEGTFEYDHGETVDLEAVAAENYILKEWTGDIETIDDVYSNETTITMEGDYSITAEFAEARNLTIEVVGEGNVTVNEELVEEFPREQQFANGTEVDLEAIPEEYWMFFKWMVDGERYHEEIENLTTEINITMDEDKEVEVHFSEMHKFTLNIEGEGNISVEQRVKEYMDEDEFEELDDIEKEDLDEFPVWVPEIFESNLKANPAEGWGFIEWYDEINEETYTTDEMIEGLVVEEEMNLTVRFGELYTLTVEEPEGEGDIYVNGEQITDWPYEGEFADGTEVELEAVSAFGYEFDQWTVDEEPYDDATIEIVMDENKTAQAHFVEVDTYELTINIEGEGQVEVDPDQDEYVEGTEVTLTANPDAGWEFVEWTGDETGTDEQITVTMDDDKTITAHFEEEVVVDTYELTINIEGEDKGQVIVEWDDEEETVEDEHTFVFEEGTAVTLTADTLEDYGFVNWNLPEDEMELDEEITITMDEDKEVTGRFGYEITLNIEGGGTVNFESEEEVIFRWRQIGDNEWLITAVEGTVLTFEAEPYSDWEFVEWEGNYPEGESEEKEITITVDDHKELTANFESDVEGVLEDLFERGMMCIALIIIIPIIIIVIIIVVVLKLLSGGDEEDQEPSQGPPPQQQQQPPQQEQPPEQPPEQQQPPSSPEDQGGSGEAPPPPENE